MKCIIALAVFTILATPALAATPAARAVPTVASAAARPASAPAAQAGDPLSREANAAFLAAYAQKKGVIKKPDGLMFRILRNGFGARPNPTDTVKVYYTGKLINDVVFDGTSPGLPAFFKVTDVIPGWIEALEMMRVGDQWEVVIPSHLGYGSHGSGEAIPPDQTLVFNVTLLQTIPPPKKGDKDYQPDPDDKDDQ
jgi:FKBP-type peptidyl-prolyl cis-trans isomerase FklB